MSDIQQFSAEAQINGYGPARYTKKNNFLKSLILKLKFILSTATLSQLPVVK